MLREKREARGVLMQDLSRRAGFSIATLSQTERGQLLPPDDTAKKLMALLDVNDDGRNQMMAALKRDRKERKRTPKESLAFGIELQELRGRLQLEVANLTAQAHSAEVARSSMNAFLTGTLLPSDATLVEKLIPLLTKLGATEADVQALKLAHLRDVLSKSLSLVYLNEEARKRIAEAAIAEASSGPASS